MKREEEIRARLQNPWKASYPIKQHKASISEVKEDRDGWSVHICNVDRKYAEFIANAPSDIDYLLRDNKFKATLLENAEAQVNDLLKENQRLRGVLEIYKHPHSWDYRQSDKPGEYTEEFIWNRFGDPAEIARQALEGEMK